MAYNLAAIRQLAAAAFSDDALKAFCFDRFPAVYLNPNAGQTQGQQVYAAAEFNVRQTPGHLGKPDSDSLLTLAAGTPLIVRGPSQTVDGLTWWPVQVTLAATRTVDGWAAQAVGGTTLLSASHH
jgi:hypothetical protein